MCHDYAKGRNPKFVIRQFDVIDEEMKKNDELSSIELQRILLAYCNITVSGTCYRILSGTRSQWNALSCSCSERAPAPWKFWRSFGVRAAFHFAFQ